MLASTSAGHSSSHPRQRLLPAQLRAIFSTRRPCCNRVHTVMESETQESKDFLEELNIEFDKPDAVFYPGERIMGKIAITAKQGCILSTNKVQLTLSGSARLLRNSKREDSSTNLKENARKDEIIYLRKEITLIDKNTSFSETVSYVNFEDRLPANLATSIECKHARVLYTARACLDYHNGKGLTRATAVHGFSVVERTDLNLCSKTHFEAVPISAHRKFGLCSCIGGQMRCSLNIEKMAFVCGEYLSITGRIENRSDRRIEKVSVTIQQILRTRETRRNAEANKEEISWSVDNVDIHEDFLALFVDAGANIKIDRKLHIPPLPPSTPNELEMQAPVHPSNRRSRMSLSHARVSHGSEKRKEDSSRLISISYALAFRVKSSGVDVMAMDVPVIIGSMPLHSTKTEAYNDKIELGEDPMVYKQCKTDKAIKLGEEKDTVLKCSQFMLQYVNKYPFFVDLTTSSKQSKKISMLASAIRAEGKLMKNVRDGRRLGERLGTVDSGTGTDTGHSSITDMSGHRTSYVNDDFHEDDEDLHRVILVKKGPVMLEVQRLAATTPVISL